MCSFFSTAATSYDYVLNALDNIPSSGMTKSPAEKQAAAILKELSTVSGYNATYGSIFSDAYFCGDSIIYPLAYYNYVYSSNASGQVGARIEYLDACMPTIIASEPSYVVFHFGMNCLSSSSYLTKTFIPTYKSLIHELQSAVPDVTVFISCLFPASAAGAASVVNYNLRTEFNAELRKMCDENGWFFLNSEELVNKLIPTMSSDGLHLYGTFYNAYWLKYVMMETGLMGLSILGDADRNGTVQAADARIALRATVGLTPLTIPLNNTCDTDADGELTAADARNILRISVGLQEIPTRETEFLAQLNALRRENGHPPLQYDAKLSNLAAGRALDMQRTASTSHNTALYGLPFDAMDNRGISYTTAAECIVSGSSSKWSYENGNDSSHSSYTKVGIGFSPNTNICVVLFTD